MLGSITCWRLAIRTKPEELWSVEFGGFLQLELTGKEASRSEIAKQGWFLPGDRRN